MKIAIGVRKFCQVGGQEQFCLCLADYLAARGHKVSVYTFRGEDKQGITVNRIPKPLFRPRYCRDWATGRALSRALLQSGADVTFGEQKTWGAHVIRPGGGVEQEYWAYKIRRKWKLAGKWIQPFYLKRWYDLAAERQSLLSMHTRAIIANSRNVREALLKHYPEIQNKIHLIPNGSARPNLSPDEAKQMRTHIRSEYQIPDSALLAMFAGHDFHRKGLTEAILTLAQVHKQSTDHPWHLLVCGRGSPRSYRRLAKHLGISTYLHFVGCQHPCEELYASADLLLLPTHYDPFANVTVEALAAGLPVITTKQNGGSDIIEHNKNGWVVPNHTNIREMAGYMLDITTPAVLQKRKADAVASAKHHRMQDRLAQVEALLTQVAQKHRQTPSSQ